MCANFHLNWMKTVEVVPPKRFCNGLTDRWTNRPTDRAQTPTYIHPNKLRLAGV